MRSHLRLALVAAPVGQLRVGHTAPLFGRQIDHAVGAWRGARRVAKRAPSACRSGGMSSKSPSDVGDKPRNQQENSGQQDEAAAAVGLQAVKLPCAERDA